MKAAASRKGELLSVRDLSVAFDADEARLHALDGISLDVPRASIVALVGESGCGKSVAVQTILRLLPSPPAHILSGSITLEGTELLTLTEREMERVRGGRVAMIFQEPMSSLNPVYTIGAQIAEAVRLHRKASRREARARALEVLAKVGFPRPDERIDDYPHQLSGGMRQRVMIAMALASNPVLLLADEPTTALDNTVQAQILDLIRELVRETSMSVLLVSHDLAVVGEVADEIVVLYAGQVVEQGPSRAILDEPLHPYTRGLLLCIPPRGAHHVRGKKRRRLPVIDGAPPDLRFPIVGCRFAARCPDVLARCTVEPPPVFSPAEGRQVRCWLSEPSDDARESDPLEDDADDADDAAPEEVATSGDPATVGAP